MSGGIPFGNFQLIRRIARGGMAEVFQASQRGPEGFERTVAIKRILPHLADSPEFIAMFMDEARLAARLSHPNVAHIYEFGKVEDSYFIAMEYIDGIDLAPIILAGTRSLLPLAHAARIAADVAAGLNYAHQAKGPDGRPLGIVHRDISPQNILVSFDGVVKVVDFGIAKAADAMERTQPGVIRGKYTYMSPEQVRGQKLDARSDVFCLGIVLSELATGQTLFSRVDAMAAMTAIRDGAPPTLRREGKPLPGNLEAIIQRALARDAEFRYPDAASLQLDLEQFLHGASEISNSLVLAEYFREHYRKLRPEAQAIAGTAVVDPGTLSVPPARPLGTLQVAGVVDSVPVARRASGEHQTLIRFSHTSEEPVPRDLDPDDLDPDDLDPDDLDPDDLEPADDDLSAPTQSDGPPLLRTQAVDREEAVTRVEISRPQRAPIEPASTGPFSPWEPPLPPDDGTATVALHPSSTQLVMATDLRRSRRRKLGLLIGALILVPVSGVLGYFLAAPKTTSPDGDPLASLGVVDSSPRATPSDLGTQGPADLGKRHQQHAADASPAADLARRRDARAARSDATAPSPPIERVGGLRIDSRPRGARVGIDGELAGATPTTWRGSAGRHTVTVSLPGYHSRRRLIDVRAGRSTTLRLKLRRRRPPIKRQVKPIKQAEPGYVSVATTPWSRVYLGQRLLGMSPFANVQVPAGKQTLRFVNPKIGSVTRKVRIVPGKLTKLRFKLR